jgi:hypothetical protein
MLLVQRESRISFLADPCNVSANSGRVTGELMMRGCDRANKPTWVAKNVWSQRSR